MHLGYLCLVFFFSFLFLIPSERNRQLRRKRRKHRQITEILGRLDREDRRSWGQRTSRKDDLAAYKMTKKKSTLSWKRQNITDCDRVFWKKRVTPATQAIFDLMFIVREKRVNESASWLRNDDYRILRCPSKVHRYRWEDVDRRLWMEYVTCVINCVNYKIETVSSNTICPWEGLKFEDDKMSHPDTTSFKWLKQFWTEWRQRE